MPILELLVPSSAVLSFLVAWIVVVTALAGVTLVATSFLRQRSSVVRHSVLLAGLFAVFLSPVALFVMQVTNTKTVDLRRTVSSFGLPDLRVPNRRSIERPTLTPLDPTKSTKGSPAISEVQRDQNSAAQAAVLRKNSAASASDSSISIMAIIVTGLVTTWLIGFVVLAYGFLRGCFEVRRLMKESRPNTDVEVQAEFEETLRLLGSSIHPRLLRSSEVSTPMVVGIVRPTIVLPQGIEQELDHVELRSVLLHEMAHIVRHDNFVGISQKIIGMIWWPHPFVHRLNRLLSQAREEICDNYTLMFSGKHEYARTLVKMSTRRPARELMASTVGLLQPLWPLEDRVEGLLDDKRHLTIRFSRIRAMAIVAVMISGTILIAGTAIMPAADEREVIDFIKSLGAEISEPDNEGHRTVRLHETWEGTSDEMADLKHIRGIKDIQFYTGAKSVEVRIEDLPDLEYFSFSTYLDETTQKQSNLPIKTVHLKNLPKIKVINLNAGYNNFYFTQLATLELAGMNNLTDLEIEGLQLQDEVLFSVAGAPNLTSIQVSRPNISSQPGGRTKVTDAGLKQLSSLKSLTRLDLSGARITDAGTKIIGKLSTLEALGLDGTDITDESIKNIAGLTRLLRLGVSETSITDAGLRQIVIQWPKLQAIALAGSQVTASGLQILSGLTELKLIQLDSSQLTDESCTVLSALPINMLLIHGSSKQPGRLSGFPNVGMAMIQGVENLSIAPDALPRIKALYLRGVGSDATRSVFQHFQHVPQLYFLEVSPGYDIAGHGDGTQLPHVDDELMQHVTHLKALKGLFISDSKVTDSGASVLGQLVELELLKIYSDNITDASLNQLKSLKKLQRLLVGSVNINQDAGAKLRADLPETEIQIYKNPPR